MGEIKKVLYLDFQKSHHTFLSAFYVSIRKDRDEKEPSF